MYEREQWNDFQSKHYCLKKLLSDTSGGHTKANYTTISYCQKISFSSIFAL